MKLTVAEAAVEAGATFVNDVTAFRHEPEIAGFVADRGCDRKPAGLLIRKLHAIPARAFFDDAVNRAQFRAAQFLCGRAWATAQACRIRADDDLRTVGFYGDRRCSFRRRRSVNGRRSGFYGRRCF